MFAFLQSFGGFTLKDSSSPTAMGAGRSKRGQQDFGAALGCPHGCCGAEPHACSLLLLIKCCLMLVPTGRVDWRGMDGGVWLICPQVPSWLVWWMFL